MPKAGYLSLQEQYPDWLAKLRLNQDSIPARMRPTHSLGH
jgi:hypothetical protein